MLTTLSVSEAQERLQQGEVIAYPTEAVYGLGCDPLQPAAVEQLLRLKQRPVDKGLIILIYDWQQLANFIALADIPPARLDAVRASWPGPVTWIFPPSPRLPSVLSGAHQGLAIRMSAHPVARALCQSGPVISTSANVSGAAPARSMQELEDQFGQALPLVVGELGGALQPSAIYDVLTGVQWR